MNTSTTTVTIPGYGVVTYRSDEATRDAVFAALLSFFVLREVFNGESLYQSDAVYEFAPDLLAEIADDIIAFDVELEE